MVRVLRGLGLAVVCGGVLATATIPGEAADGSPAGRVVRVAQKTKTKKKMARGKKADEPAMTPSEETPAPAPAPAASADGELKFSRDIAPIIVANCAGCHITPPKKRGDFDMTTFQKLIDGTKKEKVIVPGNPDESHLVLRIRGEETPKMPQGAMRNLSEEAITRIENWVKAGARLDAGKDPNAPIESYASSPEDLRRGALAKMTPEQRDKQVETVGLERWKKASKTTPEVTTGSHFLLFSTLPKARATSLLKKMDEEFKTVQNMLGPATVDWGEKGSLFVFNDAGSYGEFVQALEQREVEAGDTGTSRLGVPEPYVAVIDPQGGRDVPEPSAAAAPSPKKTSRSKRARAAAEEASVGGGERSLTGVAVEHFVIGAAAHTGKPPRWVTLGLGALLASRFDPGAAYYRKLRHDAFELCNLGWQSKANEALGDQEKVEVVRATGFAIMEWINSADRTAVGPLVKAMAGGGGKLDDAIGKVLNMGREDFLSGSGQFVMNNYGR